MSAAPCFRRARPADLPAIVALLANDPLGSTRESSEEPLDPGYAAAFAAIERDPNQQLIVADRDGAVIGVLQLGFIPGLTRRGGWRGQIEGVRIANHERGTGAGRALLEWAIALCREQGCGLVQLTSDNSRAAAHAFYEALGFTATHRGYKLPLQEHGRQMRGKEKAAIPT